MKIWMKAIAALALSGLASLAAAETLDEAKSFLAMAQAEIASKGMTAAAGEFNAGGKWKRGRSYVVLVNFNGTLIAHADNVKMAGKHMLNAKDASGNPFVQQTIQNVRTSGESLVEFRWANPSTQKIDNGRLLARRVPGQDAYVAISFFE